MFGRGQPDLITAVITSRKDRSFQVVNGQLLSPRCLGC
jgi:hypothetical protein